MFHNSTIKAHRMYQFAMEQHQKWMKSAEFPKAVFPLIATVVLLSCTLPVAVISARPEYWYEPPCRMHDFTWTTQSGRTQECSYIDLDVCRNPLSPLRDESLRPPPVSNVQATDYTTEFIAGQDQYSQWEGTWSCLNFTFQIGPEAAGKIQGILFSRRSLNLDSDDYGSLACQAFDFGGPLDADALIGEDGGQLELFFDCFRGQDPGMEYEYTIRTLPVIDINGEDPRDTAVTMRYRTQSCYHIPNDYLCVKHEGVIEENELCSHWRPQYLNVTSEYLDLSVEVELGPEECGFNTFRISVPTVSEHNSGSWSSGFTDFDVKNMSYHQTYNSKYGRKITFIRMNLNTGPGQRVVKITPQPDPNTCFTKDGQNRMCSNTLSAEIKIIENPCLSGPTHCSDAVHVCKPVGSEAICICKPGYMEDDNGRCIKNPCGPLDSATQKPYNPCGVGTCIINPTQNGYSCNCSNGYSAMDGTCKVNPCVLSPCGNGTCHLQNSSSSDIEMEYSCECQRGYMEYRQTCQENPCYQSSENENNLCGYHGECQYAANDGSVSVKYICTCNSGYEYDIEQQTCQVSTKTMVVVILMSLLVVAVLISVLVVWKQRRNPESLVYRVLQKCKKGNEGIMQDITPTQSMDNVPIGTPIISQERIEIIRPSKRVKTVLLYSNDNPLHEHAVQMFAKFLEVECMCDVETPSSCENDIALMGKCQWISHILQWADKVVLLCSKGTYINWRSNSGLANPPDIFTHALAYILNSLTSLSLPDKFCVAYFDYAHRNDIPGPLSVGAVFCLMKHMDALFFRLHDMTPGSPRSKKCAPNLEEKNYATLSAHGKALHSAIKSAHDLQREAADWNERLNNDLLRGHQKLPSIPPHLLDTTSQVDDEDFDESIRKLENMNSSRV